MVSGTMCGGSIPFRCIAWNDRGVPVRCIKEDKNLDNFREWLSDNLRYFMLGGAILLIVVVLFFGVRAFMGSGKGDSSKDTVENQTTADNDQGNVPSSPANDGETDGKKDANPMETANEEITSLIKSYYKALGDKRYCDAAYSCG